MVLSRGINKYYTVFAVVIIITLISVLYVQEEFKFIKFENIKAFTAHSKEKQCLTNDEKYFREITEELMSTKDPIALNILMKTLYFMITETPNDDAKLIQFVKSLIIPPSTQPLNLVRKNKTDWSQLGQSKYIDELLKSKTNGFFIEAGGYDGKYYCFK